jgi:hypothetical protein
MVISCRCGFDSDCNPSSSGGILFTTRGTANLPERYYKKLDETRIFSHTAYNFPRLLDVCEKLARQGLARVGGRVEKDAGGEEVFVIPVKRATPSKFEDLKNPGPIAGSIYTDEEMAKIHTVGLQWAARFMDGWTVANCSRDGGWMLWESQGRKNVLVLDGLTKNETGYALMKTVSVPVGKTASLEFWIATDPRNGGWEILAKADGKGLAMKAGDRDNTMQNGWAWGQLKASLPASDKPMTIEITMRPTTSPAERKGPAAVRFTTPQLVDR